jgi:hypothetical protein
MTLKDAEMIVHAYSSLLAQDDSGDGPASYASHLPHPPATVLQAMKLWLAYGIQNRSLTEQFRNEIGTAAARLPYFIADDEARRLNAINSDFSASARAGLSDDDFIKRAMAVREVHAWTTTAMTAGLSLRAELSDFVTTVQKLTPSDSQFWQRVYAGL